LVVRTSVRPNVHSIMMPDDLGPVWLSLPSNVLSAEISTRALLDLDYYTEERFDFDAVILEEKLDFAHEQIECVFRQAVTKEALDIWR